jgi:hypothetical protein
MGLTIHFSLSLPANVPEEDALNALNLLRSNAQRLVKANFPKGKVGRLFRMDRDEIVVAKANMDAEPFGFAVQACRPIGARGAKPEVGIGFVVRLTPNWEMPVGLCRYEAETPIMVNWKADKDGGYKGQWFFFDHFKPIGQKDRAFLRTLLKAASGHGFSVQFRDEAGEEFEELKA